MSSGASNVVALPPEPHHLAPQIRFEWTAHRAKQGGGFTLVFKLRIFRIVVLSFLVRVPGVLTDGLRGDGFMRAETDHSQSDPPERAKR